MKLLKEYIQLLLKESNENRSSKLQLIIDFYDSIMDNLKTHQDFLLSEEPVNDIGLKGEKRKDGIIFPYSGFGVDFTFLFKNMFEVELAIHYIEEKNILNYYVIQFYPTEELAEKYYNKTGESIERTDEAQNEHKLNINLSQGVDVAAELVVKDIYTSLLQEAENMLNKINPHQ